jgi:hypothetical protein
LTENGDDGNVSMRWPESSLKKIAEQWVNGVLPGKSNAAGFF